MDKQELQELTGLEFNDIEEAEEYYNTYKSDDAPDFSAQVLPHLRHIQSGIPWNEMVKVRETLDTFERKNEDITRAHYSEDAQDLFRYFPVIDEDDREALDKVFSKASEHARCVETGAPPGIVTDVFERFIRLSRNLNLVDPYHDEKHAEFNWSIFTSILAGAGYGAHGSLCPVLLEDYPECPYSANLSRTEWEDMIQDAHEMRGWPSVLAWIQWRDIAASLKRRDRSQIQVQKWMKVIALFHILKHVRLCGDGGISVIYGHQANWLKLKKDQSTIAPLAGQRCLLDKLGCYGTHGGGPTGFPMTEAVKWVLATLAPRELLVRKSLSELPLTVITGPWATLQQDPISEGFVQHGCRLFGVWRASGGKVTKYTHPEDARDVIGWDFDLMDPYAHNEARKELQRVIPATYAEQSPYEIFKQHFPNLNIGNMSDEVAGVIFDLPIYCSLIRKYVPSLKNEFPLVFFMPSIPSHEQSTNQGKTVAAHTFARVFAPAIPVSVYRGSSSAPDERAAASVIEENGTIMLDEWQPAKNSGALLSHQGMQSMCTGGTLNVGKVYENTGGVHLKHSIIASCKTAPLPDDMINRSFFWFLDNLTDQDRNRPDAWRRIESGELALRMRLGAIADIETNNIHLSMQGMKTSSGKLRFPTSNALLQLMCRERGIDFTKVETALTGMWSRFVEHCAYADDTGLAQELEQGATARIRLSEMFFGLGVTDIEELLMYLAEYSKSAHFKDGWFSPGHLLKARLNLVEDNADLKDYPRLILNASDRLTNRQVSMRFGREILARIACEEYYPISDILSLAGWVLLRGPDKGRHIMLKLINTKDIEPSLAIQNYKDME